MERLRLDRKGLGKKLMETKKVFFGMMDGFVGDPWGAMDHPALFLGDQEIIAGYEEVLG